MNKSESQAKQVLAVSDGMDWETIGWCEGHDFSSYQVTPLGHLRNSDKVLMLESTNHHGYVYNELKCASSDLSFNLQRHRLVAWAFHKYQRTEDKNVVDHINGVKGDNRAKNLRWVSQQENVEFARGQAIEVRKESGTVDTLPSIEKFKQKYGEKFANIRYKLAMMDHQSLIRVLTVKTIK